MGNTRSRIFLPMLTGLLILLFVYAACSKLFTLEVFRNQLKRSPLLEQHAGFAAIAIPTAELLIALMLCFPKTTIAGLYLFTGLMLVFTAYIIAMLLSGIHLPCSCGGVIRYLGWKQHVVFNLFFIMISITCLWIIKRNKNFVDQRV